MIKYYGISHSVWLNAKLLFFDILMDSSFHTLLSLCKEAKHILLTGPIYPDGDSLSSCLALQQGIEKISEADVYVCGELSFRYDWLPFAGGIAPPTSIPNQPFDVAIILDGDRDRLGAHLTEVYNHAQHKAIVDHHISTTNQNYDVFIVDAEAASTTEIVFQLLQSWNIPITKEIATLLYVGIIFDTAGFRYSNTSPKTHLIASELLKTGFEHSLINSKVLMERQKSGIQLLGYAIQNTQYLHNGQIALCFIPQSYLQQCDASNGDNEGIVETILFIKNVQISCLCIEKGPQKVKVSLRSRCDVDVSHVASSLSPSGGGHHKAAGVVLDTQLSTLQKTLSSFLIKQLKAVYED